MPQGAAPEAVTDAQFPGDWRDWHAMAVRLNGEMTIETIKRGLSGDGIGSDEWERYDRTSRMLTQFSHRVLQLLEYLPLFEQARAEPKNNVQKVASLRNVSVAAVYKWLSHTGLRWEDFDRDEGPHERVTFLIKRSPKLRDLLAQLFVLSDQQSRKSAS